MNDQMTIEQLSQLVKKLQQEIEQLKTRRLFQMDFTPACVKQAAMGEGNRFVRSGTNAKLPTTGESVLANSSAAYFETDTNKWKIWNGTAWVSVTLS